MASIPGLLATTNWESDRVRIGDMLRLRDGEERGLRQGGQEVL